MNFGDDLGCKNKNQQQQQQIINDDFILRGKTTTYTRLQLIIRFNNA